MIVTRNISSSSLLRSLVVILMVATSGCVWAGTNKAEITWEPAYTANTYLHDVIVGTGPTFTLTFSKEGTSSTSSQYKTADKTIYFYSKNSIQFSAPEGYMLCGITLNYATTTTSYTLKPDVGTCSSTKTEGTWTGLVQNVTIANGAGLQIKISSITLSYIALTPISSVTITKAGAATYCHTKPVVVGDGTRSYVLTGVEDENLQAENLLQEENLPVIPANTGVLLYGEEGQETTYTVYTCDGLADEAVAPESNWLVGVTTDIPAILGTYILQNNDDKVGFYRVSTAGITTLHPDAQGGGKAYLQLPSTLGEAEAKAFYFNPFEVVTGITSLTAGTSYESYHSYNSHHSYGSYNSYEPCKPSFYTLNGQQTDRLHRGINLIRRPDGSVIKCLQR